MWSVGLKSRRWDYRTCTEPYRTWTEPYRTCAEPEPQSRVKARKPMIDKPFQWTALHTRAEGLSSYAND